MSLSLSKLGSHVDLNRADGYPYTRSIFSNEDIGIAASSSKAGAAVVFGHWKMPGTDDFIRNGLAHKDPYEAAQEYWNITQQFVDALRNAGADMNNIFFIGINEPVLDLEMTAKYAAYEVERMKIAESMGLHCAILSYAVGNPDLTYWAELVPALEQAHAGRHLVALHEYFGAHPSQYYADNQHELDDGTRPYDEDSISLFPIKRRRGWLLARYRWIWETVCSPLNLTNVRFVVTETGADRVGSAEPVSNWIGGSMVAWRDWVGLWRSKWHDEARAYLYSLIQGETLTEAAKQLILKNIEYGLSDEWLYMAALIWYDEQLRLDHFVVGAQVFTDGSFGWGNFDISGLMHDILYEYIAAMTPG